MRWILNWIRRRRRRKQRNIFRYFNGWRMTSIDPMAAHRALEMHPEFRWEMGHAVDAGDPDAIGAVSRAVQVVFQVDAWDPDTERGMTESECVGILFDFCTYIEDVKKKYGLGPILQQPMGLDSSIRVEDPESTTKCCSD